MCGNGRHCHAGIPQLGLYLLLCKVAIHILQSAWNEGSGSALCGNDMKRSKGRHVCKYVYTVFLFLFDHIIRKPSLSLFSPLPAGLYVSAAQRGPVHVGQMHLFLKYVCLESNPLNISLIITPQNHDRVHAAQVFSLLISARPLL